MSDCVDVEDFHFYTLRKFRIFNPSQFQVGKNRLATSSKYGITVAAGDREIRIVTLASLQSFKLNKENLNVEVEDLPIKIIQFPVVEKIEQIGINSDGTLLGVLHSTKGNAIVDIYDLKTLASSTGAPSSIVQTPVGTDANITGLAFEWNPAIPDMFATSASDRSLLCAKVDVANSKLTLVGSKKFGANANVISWSPKGKQLVIGDSVGKLVQLKPELDVVRSTMPPADSQVTGLCWLSTTEWLIAYTTEKPSLDQITSILVVKKDKPPEWNKLFDLSLVEKASTNRAALMSATNLLIDWNVSLFANTMASEVLPVGKAADAWQTWKVDDGKGINLPLNAAKSATFPLGVSIDLSAQDRVVASFDGTVHYPAAPIVLVLTSDGLLMAYHVINTNAARKSIQRVAEPLQLVGAQPFKSTSAPVAPTTPLKQTTPSVVPLQTTPKPSFSFSTASKPSTTAALPPQPTPTQPAPSKPAEPVETVPVVSEVDKKKEAERLEKEKKEKEEKEAAEKKAKELAERAKAIAEKKKGLIAAYEKVKFTINETNKSIGALTVGIQKVSPVVSDATAECSTLEEEAEEVLAEMRLLIASMKEEGEIVKRSLEDFDLELEEKKTLVAEMGDKEKMEQRMKDFNDVDKQIRFAKVEEAVDGMNQKYVDLLTRLEAVQKDFKTTQAARKAVIYGGRVHSEEDRFVSQLSKKIARIALQTDDITKKNARDLALLQKDMGKKVKSAKPQATESVPVQKLNLLPDPLEFVKMDTRKKADIQNSIRERFAKRGAPKSKRVTISRPEPYESKDEANTSVFDTSSLSEAILKLRATPRRVFGSESRASSARTVAIQVNEERVVEKVVVTVATPTSTTTNVTSTAFGQPKQPTSSLFTGVTASKTTSATTPSKPEVKTGPISTGKSLFGSTTAVNKENGAKPEEPKGSSLFGAGKTIFGMKDDKPPVLTKEEPKVVEPVIPSAEPVKHELKTETEKKEDVAPKPTEVPVTPVAAKKKEEKVVDPVTPKVEQASTAQPKSLFGSSTTTPAASVAPAAPVEPAKTSLFGGKDSTPPATGSSTSIFGGGKPAESSTPTPTSSIFGSQPATTTPASSTVAAANAFNFNKTEEKPAASSSSFGSFGQTTTTPKAPATNSGFGSFGQAAASAAQSTSPVTFSFNSGGQQKPQGSSIFGGGSTTAQPTSVFGGQAKASGFGAAAASAAQQQTADDGMEDDMGSKSAGGGSVFGGGFMSGLGNKQPQNNTGNIFSAKTNNATSSGSSNSWMFGNSSTSAKQPAATGSFGAMASAAAQQTPQTGSSIFGGAPKFGGGPSFGSAAPAQSSIFGGGGNTTGSAGGGFSQFAQSGSSLFGGGSAAPQQQKSSIFGGGTAASQQNTNNTSSIFGGSAAPKNNFTSWR